ncbi:hypothetical protein PCASD_20675, partial [Puccinia coronata f. sp. avenae]
MATLRVGVPDAATPGRGPHSGGEVDYFGGHSTRIDYISGSTTQAMDLSNNLDLHRIVFVQVGLSTLASVSVSPSYNLPVHLYGLYNIDNEVDNPSPAVLEGLRQ